MNSNQKKKVGNFIIIILIKRRSNSVTNLNPVKFCDPLGDLNVWATLFPLLLMPNSSTVENENRRTKYIVVAAKLDSTTMFDKTAGAITPITGLVTLLATAKLLKQLLPEYKNDYGLFIYLTI